MHENLSHRDPTMDTDYRPTRYGSTDSDRLREDSDVQHETRPSHTRHHHKSPYRNLVWMGILHVPVMYFIMFSMVDTAGDVFQNLNTFYMALMMAAPMVALMPLMMKEMYPDKKKNRLVIIGAMLVLIGAFAAIRFQSAIGDTQFVRSMIPHHSGAILMCEKAKISDPELKSLCNDISKAQRQEIQQMENILNRL
jgi:cation transport ATPase